MDGFNKVFIMQQTLLFALLSIYFCQQVIYLVYRYPHSLGIVIKYSQDIFRILIQILGSKRPHGLGPQ